MTYNQKMWFVIWHTTVFVILSLCAIVQNVLEEMLK